MLPSSEKLEDKVDNKCGKVQSQVDQVSKFYAELRSTIEALQGQIRQGRSRSNTMNQEAGEQGPSREVERKTSQQKQLVGPDLKIPK